ncbi:MAG: DUF2141 domain-containing protein [Sulfurospirillum sp.]
MKKVFIGFWVLCFVAAQAKTMSCALSVVAMGIRDTKGEIRFSLYNKDGTIPDKNMDKYFKMKSAKIEKNRAKVVFEDLPKGRYAISIYHDENNNHKIDQGFLMPDEGVGLSNFKTINFFNLPDFKSASFFLNCNKEVKINLIYF